MYSALNVELQRQLIVQHREELARRAYDSRLAREIRLARRERRRAERHRRRELQ